MFRSTYEKLKPFRFRLALVSLLFGASVISVALLRLRTLLSGSMDYLFLLWNLFLAWLPLGMAYLASSFASRRRYILLTVLPAAALWLLFFPNAPYILTDFFHLRHPRPEVPLWYDALLINWFAWTGILLGIVSLFMMHNIVRKAFGRITGWAFVVIVGTLSGIGIYIGRFLRWNSWDLIFHPFIRMREIMSYAANPSLQSILFIGVFSSLFIFIYVSTYSFGLLLQEQQETK